MLAQQLDQRAPEVGAGENDRKVRDLGRLYQRRRLEHLIERTKPARQHDEGVGVLQQHHLPHVEAMEVDRHFQVIVSPLLLRQIDVAANGASARFFRAPRRRLHDARPAAGHHREARLRQQPPGLPAELVVAVPLVETRRAEHRHARPDEVQLAKAVDELQEDLRCAPQL